jgi:tetratricopeptide (TPR) repeat protein
MLQLKPLSKESIPNALKRAEHYRLLNQPWQAESICRDILLIDPGHKTALLNLILAITDQFGTNTSSSDTEARELCAQLDNEYQELYYEGLIEERLGKAALKRATPRARYIAYEFYHNALTLYEKAQKIHPEDNEESLLRWNACARTMVEFNIEPSPSEDGAPTLLE